MNDFNRSKQEYDIKDFLWKLLGQWKLILIVAVVFAVLGSSAMYYRDLKSYESEKEQALELDGIKASQAETVVTKESSDEEWKLLYLDTLKDDERGDVQQLLQMHDAFDDMQEYMEKSFLMNIDYTDRHILTMEYNVLLSEETDNSIQVLSSAYKTIMGSELTTIMSDLLDSEVDEQYIRELIYVRSKIDITNAEMTTTLAFDITVPDGIDVEKLQTAVEDAMVIQSQKLSEALVPHTVQLYFAEIYAKTDYDLLSRQTDCYSKYLNMKNNMTTFENGLSTAQKEVYNQINAYQTYSGENKVDEAELTPPKLSKKWAAAGFVLGIILYLIVYTIYFVLKPYIHSKEEIKRTWNIRVLGELYQYSQKGIHRFANSKFVFNLYHKRKIDLNQQIENVTGSISGICKHKSIQGLSFVPVATVDDMGNNGTWAHINDLLLAGLSEKGVSAMVDAVMIAADDIDEEKLLRIKNMVAVVINKKTTRSMLDELIAITSEYDINLAGVVYIEG